jgi:hypothetical protein
LQFQGFSCKKPVMTLPDAHALIEWVRSHQTLLEWAGLASLFMFVGSLVAVPTLIVALPPHYLTDRTDANPLRGTLWHWPVLVVKNLLGAVLIVAGIAMLVLPGQGVLTICIGLVIVNFPGKKAIIRRILGNPRALRTVNRIRLQSGRPPLEQPEPKQSIPL